MIIKNAYVYTKEHVFEKKDIYIKEACFGEAASAEPEEIIIDAEDQYAIPGLVDIHFHGAAGYDFCSASKEELLEIAKYEAKNGILAICPATMSYNEEILGDVMDKACSYREETQELFSADLVGINMEGPFINLKKAGAQNPEYIMSPDVEMFQRLQARSKGLIKLVDIAPESEGGMNLIEQCHEEVRVSIAHTECDYDTATEAFQKGASHMTHLYNAMPGISHRQPGPIVAALEAGAGVELITDGIHVHPAMVRFTFQTFGADKVILISDSMEATGLPDGNYQLGGQAVTVAGKKAVITDKPDVIAGSVTNLFSCMKTCVLDMGVPLEQAVRAATENPARAIGIETKYGCIAEGQFANVILMDKELNITCIIQKGKILR